MRESLINAITHRDYNFSGSILIHIFDDRIEFVSLGGLVSEITKKDILFEISDNAFLVILPNVNNGRTTAPNEDTIMELIARKVTVTRKELEEELNMSKSSVNILLNKLLQEKAIKQQGKARNIKYTLYS